MHSPDQADTSFRLTPENGLPSISDHLCYATPGCPGIQKCDDSEMNLRKWKCQLTLSFHCTRLAIEKSLHQQTPRAPHALKCCPGPQLSSWRLDSESRQHFPPCRKDEQRTPKVSLSAVWLFFSQSHCRQDLNKPVSSSCHILQGESFTMLNTKPQRRVMVGAEQDGSPKIFRPNDILQNSWHGMALQLGVGKLWEEKSSVE